jgi:hypothetical protein
MDFEIPWRRIATGAAVLIFHVIAVYLLALAMHLPVPAPNQVREIVLNLMQPKGSRTIQQDLNIPTPKMIRPQNEPSAIFIPPPLNGLKAANPPEPPGDLRGIGSYLYNCSGMFYEQLNGRERLGCLANKWDEKPSSPLLGTPRASPYDALMAKRQAPPPTQGIEKQCDQAAINANLGLPCFDFTQH